MNSPRTILDPDAVAALRACDDDGSLIPELITLFDEEAPKRLVALRRAIAANSTEALASEAHALKSCCSQLGARGMAGLAQRLEMQGRQGAIDGVGPTLAELEALLAPTAEALRDLVTPA